MTGIVIVTLKIMPESPETNLESIYNSAVKHISVFGGNVGKKDIEPIAFGLRALVIMFSMSEDKGSTDELEKQLAAIPEVNSVQVTDMRRAVG